MSISVEDFGRLQTELITLKSERYAGIEREKKLQQEIEILKKEKEKLEKEHKKAAMLSSMIMIPGRSKEKDKVSGLVDEVETLRSMLESSKTESQEQLSALRTQIQILRDQNSTLKTEAEETQARAVSLAVNEKVQLIQEQKREFETKIKNLQDTISGLHSDLRKSAVQQQSLLASISQQRQDQQIADFALAREIIKSHKQNLESSGEPISDRILSEINGMLSEIPMSGAEIINSAAAAGSGISQTSPKKERAASAGDSFGSGGSGDSEAWAQLSIVQMERNALQHEVEGLQAQLASLRAEQDASQQGLLAKITEREGMVAHKEDQIRSLEKELEDFTKELRSAREAKLFAEKDIEKLKANHDAIISKLKEESHKMNEEKSSVHSQLADARKHVEALTRKCTDLESTLNDFSKELTNSREAKENIARELASMRPLMEEKNRLEMELRSTESTKDACMAQIQRLNAKERELTDRCSVLDKEAESLKAKNMSTAAYCEQLQDQLRHQTVTAKSLQTTVDTQSTQLSLLQTEIEKLKHVRAQLTASLEDSERQVLKYLSKTCVANAGVKQEGETVQRMLEKIAELESRKSALEADLVTASDTLSSLQRSYNDLSLEVRISERKSQQMMKEIKNQLQRERALREKAEAMQQQQQSGGSQLTSSTLDVPQDFSATGLRSPSMNRLSTESSATSDAGQEVQAIIHENNVLAKRLADVQAEKWKVDEKTRFLEESIQLAQEEVDRKNKVIQYYVQREKSGRLLPPSPTDGGPMSPGDKSGHNKNMKKTVAGAISALSHTLKTPLIGSETQEKMQSVLEEALVKNMQLQGDVGTLGNEIERLSGENKKLKAELMALSNRR